MAGQGKAQTGLNLWSQGQAQTGYNKRELRAVRNRWMENCGFTTLAQFHRVPAAATNKPLEVLYEVTTPIRATSHAPHYTLHTTHCTLHTAH